MLNSLPYSGSGAVKEKLEMYVNNLRFLLHNFVLLMIGRRDKFKIDE